MRCQSKPYLIALRILLDGLQDTEIGPMFHIIVNVNQPDGCPVTLKSLGFPQNPFDNIIYIEVTHESKKLSYY